MVRHIHEYVLNIVQKTSVGRDDSLLDDCDDKQEDYTRTADHTVRELLNYGLTVMANSLELLSVFESWAVVRRFLDFCSQSDFCILTSLLMDLGRAEFQPHNACLAAKCLRILCESSPDAREFIKTLSGLEYAFLAEQIGKTTNARLKQESAALLIVLKGESEEIDAHSGTRSCSRSRASNDSDQSSKEENGDKSDDHNKDSTNASNDASKTSKSNGSLPESKIDELIQAGFAFG
jgi:hypothetical protein